MNVPEDMAKRIGAVLRDRRMLLGLSQGQLAERVETYRPNVGRVEAGRHELKLSTLYAYAVALHTTPGQVLAWAGIDGDARLAEDQRIKAGVRRTLAGERRE